MIFNVIPARAHSRGRGGSTESSATVRPDAYARARAVEDRLIKLIDGGEDLAKWGAPRPWPMVRVR